MHCYLITSYGELVATKYAETMDDALDWYAINFNNGSDSGLMAYKAPEDF